MRYAFLFVLYCQLSFAESIHFEGVPAAQSAKIKKLISNSETHEYSYAEIDDIIKVLYESNQFEKLRAIRKGTTIFIQGEPLKKISKIGVSGVNQFSKSDILKVFAVNVDEVYLQQNLYDGAEAIKEFYGKKGYFNTIVSIAPQIDPEGRVAISIEVDEKDPCKIKEISFITENEELKNLFAKKLKSFVKENFSESVLSDLESELREQFISERLLSAILKGPNLQYNETKTQVSLVYIIENPYSYVLFFEGQSAVSENDINDIINKLEINTQNQFGSNPTAELTNRIRKIYEDKGYALVNVSTQEKINAQSFTRKIFFKIDEGFKIKIKELQIRGSISNESKFYSDFIKEHSSPLVQEGFYNAAQIKQGVDNLVTELQNRGYLQAKSISTQATYAENKKTVVVTILLDEGPITKISKINLNGIQAFSKLQLLGVLNLKENSPLRLSDIENSIQTITNFYKQNGYMDMKVTNSSSEVLKYNADHTRADIELNIEEGPKVIVGGIIVEGNELTKEYVITKELNFVVGDVLTPEKVSDSEYNLQRSGLYSQVSISQLEIGTTIPQRNIIVKVIERDPGLFNFGLGINSEFILTLRGFLGISYKNLAGTGRAISSRLDIKKVTDINFIDYKVGVSYFEPFVFDTKTRGRVNLIRASEILSRNNTFPDQIPGILGADTNKVQFLLERDLTRKLKLTWNFWTLSQNREYDILRNNLIFEDDLIGTVGPTLELDYRNNSLVPTSGTYSKLDFQYADPVLASSQNVKFLQTMGSFSWYTPSKFLNMVWANKLEGGYLSNLLQYSGNFIPDITTYKLGGRDTIRGFDPLSIPGVDSSGNALKVATDSHYYLVKSEFRIPIVGQFETVLFYDGGGVKISGVTLRDEYRDSAGVGLRYVTPAGPFRIEYGQKLDPGPGEINYHVHISFGTF